MQRPFGGAASFMGVTSVTRILTPVQAAQALVAEGFTGWPVVTFGAIGMAESRLDAHALNRNDHDPTSRAYPSVDHGWLQINDFWQQVTIREVLGTVLPVSMLLADPRLCARVALRIFLAAGGAPKGYYLWNTYEQGLHIPYLPQARKAAKAVGVNV